MKNILKILSILCGLPLVVACSGSSPLPVVDTVDLKRYQGLWYDIAHLPQSDQKNCKCITAKYNLLEEYLEFVNTCVDSESGSLSQQPGNAYPIDRERNARLTLNYENDGSGYEYFILALEEDYRYAMVGTPDRRSLWILSRTPEPVALIMKNYLNRAEELGFNTAELVYTDQSCYAESIE